jgi:hypothetical protein
VNRPRGPRVCPSTPSSSCAAPAAGWIYDAATGTVSLSPAARSDKAALITRGGPINSIAREVLPGYGLAMMRGFDLSVPLHASHVGARGVAELDCLHYCQHGLPEVGGHAGRRAQGVGAGGRRHLGVVFVRPAGVTCGFGGIQDGQHSQACGGRQSTIALGWLHGDRGGAHPCAELHSRPRSSTGGG